MAADARDEEAVPGPDAVDVAINRVLRAERDAREEVEQSRGEAARIISAAEIGAARIERRTEERIKAVHRTADRAVEEALRELLGSAPTPEVKADATRADARLERAVERLVEEMLGNGP